LIGARPQEIESVQQGSRAKPNQLKEITMFKNLVAIAIAATFGTAAFAQTPATTPAKPGEVSKPAATTPAAAAPAASASASVTAAKPEVKMEEKKGEAKPHAQKASTKPASKGSDAKTSEAAPAAAPAPSK
jgi:hypothetical protein